MGNHILMGTESPGKAGENSYLPALLEQCPTPFQRDQGHLKNLRRKKRSFHIRNKPATGSQGPMTGQAEKRELPLREGSHGAWECPMMMLCLLKGTKPSTRKSQVSTGKQCSPSPGKWKLEEAPLPRSNFGRRFNLQVHYVYTSTLKLTAEFTELAVPVCYNTHRSSVCENAKLIPVHNCSFLNQGQVCWATFLAPWVSFLSDSRVYSNFLRTPPNV